MKNEELLETIEFSIHKGLLGEIIPSLRQVGYMWEPGEKRITVLFFHDGEVTPSLENHYSLIASESDSSYFGDDTRLDYTIVRCDYPNDLPKIEHVIYKRKESLPKIRIAADKKKESGFINKLIVLVIRTLIGEVIPELRQLALKWDSNNRFASIIFYHDGEVHQKIKEHYSKIIDKLKSHIVCDDFDLSYQITRLDCPSPLPKEEFLIYLRREPFDNPTEGDTTNAYREYLNWKKGGE